MKIRDLGVLLIVLAAAARFAQTPDVPLEGCMFDDFERGDFAGLRFAFGDGEFSVDGYNCGGSYEAERGSYRVQGRRLELLGNNPRWPSVFTIGGMPGSLRLEAPGLEPFRQVGGSPGPLHPKPWNGERLSIRGIFPGMPVQACGRPGIRKRLDDGRDYLEFRSPDGWPNEPQVWARNGVVEEVVGTRVLAGDKLLFGPGTHAHRMQECLRQPFYWERECAGHPGIFDWTAHFPSGLSVTVLWAREAEAPGPEYVYAEGFRLVRPR